MQAQKNPQRVRAFSVRPIVAFGQASYAWIVSMS